VCDFAVPADDDEVALLASRCDVGVEEAIETGQTMGVKAGLAGIDLDRQSAGSGECDQARSVLLLSSAAHGDSQAGSTECDGCGAASDTAATTKLFCPDCEVDHMLCAQCALSLAGALAA